MKGYTQIGERPKHPCNEVPLPGGGMLPLPPFNSSNSNEKTVMFMNGKMVDGKKRYFYSFRAEFFGDVGNVIYVLNDMGRSDYRMDIKIGGMKASGFNEPVVEFSLAEKPIDLEEFSKRLYAHFPDAHVMIQTLRLKELKDNSLERDYDL